MAGKAGRRGDEATGPWADRCQARHWHFTILNARRGWAHFILNSIYLSVRLEAEKWRRSTQLEQQQSS